MGFPLVAKLVTMNDHYFALFYQNIGNFGPIMSQQLKLNPHCLCLIHESSPNLA